MNNKSFFEQLGKKISDAGQGATQQAKNFAEVNRLNGMINDSENKISQLYSEIGQCYYERHNGDSQAEEIERIAKINELNAEIRQHRERIKQIKGVTKCPDCGADVPLNAAFCSVCGTKIPPVVQSETDAGSDSANLCPRCGKPVVAGNLFCNYCGAKLNNSEKLI